MIGELLRFATTTLPGIGNRADGSSSAIRSDHRFASPLIELSNDRACRIRRDLTLEGRGSGVHVELVDVPVPAAPLTEDQEVQPTAVDVEVAGLGLGVS